MSAIDMDCEFAEEVMMHRLKKQEDKRPKIEHLDLPALREEFYKLHEQCESIQTDAYMAKHRLESEIGRKEATIDVLTREISQLKIQARAKLIPVRRGRLVWEGSDKVDPPEKIVAEVLARQQARGQVIAPPPGFEQFASQLTQLPTVVEPVNESRWGSRRTYWRPARVNRGTQVDTTQTQQTSTPRQHTTTPRRQVRTPHQRVLTPIPGVNGTPRQLVRNPLSVIDRTIDDFAIQSRATWQRALVDLNQVLDNHLGTQRARRSTQFPVWNGWGVNDRVPTSNRPGNSPPNAS